MKHRIYEIIEIAEAEGTLSKLFDYFIITMITLTCVSVFLESFSDLYSQYENRFRLFEIITVIIFTIEYFLRVWTADQKYPKMSLGKATIKYAVSYLAIIDLLAILPFYIPMIITIDLRFLRIIRLTRVFRLFKLNRYSKALMLIGRVCRRKKEELLTTVYLMLFNILISSTLIYYIESEYQPEQFPNIVASFWWAIATLTTVGYGDIYPITTLGKVLASIIAHIVGKSSILEKNMNRNKRDYKTMHQQDASSFLWYL